MCVPCGGNNFDKNQDNKTNKKHDKDTHTHPKQCQLNKHQQTTNKQKQQNKVTHQTNNSTVRCSEQQKGTRFLPRQCVLEMNETLPTSASMGHHMMTAGLKPYQYFWCELCCSYTGQRARKLAHQCDRVRRKVPAVDLLRKGFSPYDGTPLTTKPRRLCKRDVGSHSWSGEGRPDDNLMVCEAGQATHVSCDGAWDTAMDVHVAQHADEGDMADDPLGLGYDLG